MLSNSWLVNYQFVYFEFRVQALRRTTNDEDLLDFWISEITVSRLCKRDATNRKIEHMPNITVIGNASTFKQGNGRITPNISKELQHYPMPELSIYFSS